MVTGIDDQAGEGAVYLWERQEWDTNTSFARFREFYLRQEPPRSLTDAYNSYRIKKDGPKAAQKRHQPPGTWKQWFYGRNRDGTLRPGAVSWEERAAAYDQYRRRALLAEELKEAQEMRKKVRTLLQGAFARTAGALNNLQVEDLSPQQLTGFMGLVLTEIRNFYDLQPVQRIEATEGALEQWKRKRAQQLAILADEWGEAGEGTPRPAPTADDPADA